MPGCMATNEGATQMANKSSATVVRDAIRRDSRSLTRLARDAGVSQSMVSRFVGGQRGVTIDTMDRLIGTLGYELRPHRRSA